MAQSPMRQRIQWLAVHGVVRGMSKVFARQGDPQGRLVADPAVRADPVAFIEELRAHRPDREMSRRLHDRRPQDRQ